MKSSMSCVRAPYIRGSQLLLCLQQQDALVDGSDGAQRAGVSLQIQRGPLSGKLLQGGKL